MLDEAYRNRNMLPVRPDWLARRREEAIDPALPIVDPHHHLWRMPQCPYLIEDLAADATAGHNVLATVYVEAHTAYRAEGPEALRPVGETEFVTAEIAREEARTGAPTPLCAGIVGAADFTLGDRVEQVLEAHVAAGRGRFRGLRLRAATHPDPAFAPPAGAPPEGFLLRPEVQAAVACLGRLGLVLDVWVFQTQLRDVAALAEACPGIRMVLNHVGGVLGIGPFEGRREEVFPAWREELRALARFDNLHVKLGGLCMPRVGFRFHDAELPPSSAELAAAWRPYVEASIEAFGASRCMFESNFPVDKGMCGYVEAWNAFKRIASGASAPEKADLFAGTARRFYGLDTGG
jgi:predicted TIM-barrel fold metal-dependent hydrolase